MSTYDVGNVAFDVAVGKYAANMDIETLVSPMSIPVNRPVSMEVDDVVTPSTLQPVQKSSETVCGQV